MRNSFLAFFCWLLLGASVVAQEWQLDKLPGSIWVQPGEAVTVTLVGPPGQRAFLGERELTEYRYGHYFTVWRAPSSGRHVLGFKSLSGALPELLTVEVDPKSLTFTAHQTTVTRQGPDADYERLTPLPAGAQVTVDGQRGLWYRSAATGAWLDGRTGAVSELPAAPSRLTNVIIENDPNGDTKLTLSCGSLAESFVEMRDGQALTLTLPSTENLLFELVKPSRAAHFLGPITVRPLSSGGTVLEVVTGAKGIGGYQLEHGNALGELVLRVRQPVPRSLDGLVVTVDAGHGGASDPGTVGHGGLPEKVLNLRVAEALERQLQARGATVVMTRTSDTSVAADDDSASHELQARVDLSVERQAHLFLSLHHNARPSVEEGKISHGTDIYWYQPWSEPLARALVDPIADAVGEPLRTSRFRSFHVIRQTFSPSVLIEFQYLSNPTLEADLLDRDGYAERAAAGVVKGLEAYLDALP